MEKIGTYKQNKESGANQGEEIPTNTKKWVKERFGKKLMQIMVHHKGKYNRQIIRKIDKPRQQGTGYQYRWSN